MNTNLTINIGKDEYGQDLVLELNNVGKHLLMAGATGSGKSTLIHRIITTLISNNSPEALRLILIDPKRVELTMYKNISHILTPTIVEPRKALLALKWVTKEISRRYDVLEQAGFTYVDDYKGKGNMPHIVAVVDEFSDLMQTYPKEIEEVVMKIAQMGYAVGVHIILSTSRPSTKIYTKKILDEITAHIALQTGSPQDSKLIIGTEDAYKLRGAGDILFRDGMKYAIRAQVDPISEKEIKEIVKLIQGKYKEDTSVDLSADDSPEESDDMYESVKEAVMEAGKVSTSYIQRKFGLGYSRSAQLMDMLERHGIIGPANGSKPREVIKK